MTDDIDLSGYDWIPAGNSDRKYMEIYSQQELDEMLERYTPIYDSAGNSYTRGTEKNSKYSENETYYYIATRIFSGTFDGDGHAISGMKVSSDCGYAGLFGNVNGTLQDFTLSGTVEYASANADYIGGVTGMLSEGGNDLAMLQYGKSEEHKFPLDRGNLRIQQFALSGGRML